MKPIKFRLSFLFLILVSKCFTTESKCSKTCDFALASYYMLEGTNLTYILDIMKSNLVSKPEDIVSYNPDTIPNKDSYRTESRAKIPFPCDCINDKFLGHTFLYQYQQIAELTFSNLTNEEWMERENVYAKNSIPKFVKVNATVNCFCGNRKVSKDYGLFITYPLRSEDSLESIAKDTEIEADLLQRYNPGVNFSQGHGIVFIPGKDKNGVYVPFPPSPIKAGHLARSLVTAAISIGGICMLLLLSICIYVKKNIEKSKLTPEDSTAPSTKDGTSDKDSNADTGSKFIVVDKSPEFSYEDLANATNNFSLANKIGQGGFGEVYYGELKGKKTAIKKMTMLATREFLAEMKVLTSVHHRNLVRLIGYCIEGSLFLVYEYMDNGNLSQHLHNSEKEPMTWSTRLQIALDVARGLEYIHDHSVPVYIHRDIKSDNILLNGNFNGKIADFGMTKLTDVASSIDNTDHVAGTFGYMPPENAYGHISRKIDVYAFGVVLYELISAKAAVVKIDKPTTEFKSLEIKTNESIDEYKSLVALFDEVIDQEGDPIEEGLRKLVDPRLGDNYSIDSINKMAQLAKTCINRDPKRRPRMGDVVVSLMKLNSTIDGGSTIVQH
ncbi:lysM domain receptor-like kinase 3 [Trifolium pratense]|uniref:lysM domain receptor-like kinase 3 n=1 Tax=Trifolium pratense TaxID=57577 RepID=UPI001E693B98|nr:lysM domain receptor-like kinase 3 [Trifolium pratense]